MVLVGLVDLVFRLRQELHLGQLVPLVPLVLEVHLRLEDLVDLVGLVVQVLL